MVTVIRVGSSIRRTFHYNENKVKEGVAELIMASNYPMDLELMNEHQRLNMLLKTAESNTNVKANSVHITLNFSPEEQLSNEQLQAIAQEYMDEIGFGGQPFLVYKHMDAAHPHIHIATVKVGLDGKRIETQNIGKTLSETARKAIEIKYGLVKAEDQKQSVFQLKPIDFGKVAYGKTVTKRAIATVLDGVLETYKYTSLPELNAVLNLYNVAVSRGEENSRIHKHGGLIYQVLNEDGNPIGMPIKASLFYNKPILKSLEKRFLKNEVARQEHKAKIKSTIDFAFKKSKINSVQDLERILIKDGIKLVIRRNKEGSVYGLTYVDFKSKTIFNGSALGKNYSAKQILERMDQFPAVKRMVQEREIPNGNSHVPDKQTGRNPEENGVNPKVSEMHDQENSNDGGAASHEKSLFDLLTQYEYASNQLPFEWKKRKKRRKRRDSF